MSFFKGILTWLSRGFMKSLRTNPPYPTAKSSGNPSNVLAFFFVITRPFSALEILVLDRTFTCLAVADPYSHTIPLAEMLSSMLFNFSSMDVSNLLSKLKERGPNYDLVRFFKLQRLSFVC